MVVAIAAAVEVVSRCVEGVAGDFDDVQDAFLHSRERLDVDATREGGSSVSDTVPLIALSKAELAKDASTVARRCISQPAPVES